MTTYCPICEKSNEPDAQICAYCKSPISRYSPDGTLSCGTVIKNLYRIEDVVKVGGMGAVYRGLKLDTKTIVAIKELYIDVSSEEEDEVLVKRFEMEAELLAKLFHPNLPKVSDYFYDHDNYFMIMDFVEGTDLEELLEKEGKPGLPEKKVIEWAIEICNVLDYLHNQRPKILYRDIKPSNIIIRASDKKAILVDFGIARPLTDGLTSGKTVIGTIGYSPPEQYEGRQKPQSDIYALGATLHHLVTGKFPEIPFKFEPVCKLNPRISKGFEELTMKALELEIKNRYKSAGQMKEALEELIRPKELRNALKPGKQLEFTRESAELSKAHSNIGVLYAKQGLFDRAKQEFEQAISLDPGSSETYSNLGYTYLQAEDYDNAIKYFNNAIEVNPKLSGAHCNLGVVYSRKGMTKEAAEEFRKALELDPHLVNARINLAHIYGKNNLYKEMIAECEKAMKLKPDCIEAYINYAFGCGKLGLYDNGIRKLNKALIVDSSNAFVYSNLGVLYSETGNYDKAVEAMNKAISINPESAEAYSNLATIYYKQGKVEESKKNFKKAVEIKGDFLQAKYNLAKIYKEHGIDSKEKEEVLKLLSSTPEEIEEPIQEPALTAMPSREIEKTDNAEGFITFEERKNYDEEKRRLEALIEINPDDIGAYIKLGKHYVEQGKYDEGIRQYQQAMRVKPGNTEVRFNMALAYEKKGLNILAEGEYKKVIKTDPTNKEAVAKLGSMLFEKKDFDELVDVYSKYVAITPDSGEGNFRLGIAHKERGDLKKALACFEEAMSRGYATAENYFNLGLVYYEYEKSDQKAEQFLRLAISKKLNYPEANLYLGNIYYKRKVLNEARNQYEEAIDLKPDYAVAYSNLGAVYTELNKLDKALGCYFKAIELEPNIAETHRNLGVLYQKKGDFMNAIKEMKTYLNSEGQISDRKEIMKRIQDMEESLFREEKRKLKQK